MARVWAHSQCEGSIRAVLSPFAAKKAKRVLISKFCHGALSAEAVELAFRAFPELRNA
jgi:hypothetical protein